MKKIAKIALGIAGAALVASSCTKVLEEHPKTNYTPDFFSTSMGVEGGLTALYGHLRYLYGNGYYYNILTTGTDEATWGMRSPTSTPPAASSRTPRPWAWTRR